MDESEGTSIDVTSDSENSDVGEGLINCIEISSCQEYLEKVHEW